MRFSKLLDSGIPIFSGLLLILMVIFTFLQIILRELFSFSLNWSDEATQFSMIWMVLFGSIWLTKNDRHINTGFKLHQKLNNRLLYLIDGLLALITVISAAVIAYQSALFVLTTINCDSNSLPWLKMGYVYIALPIFMLTLSYYYLKSFLKNLRLIFKKN
jgi:C4-dicarboxylate transporter DctQ subunit